MGNELSTETGEQSAGAGKKSDCELQEIRDSEQGYHDVETGPEAGFQWENCTKNPEHPLFIPINSFTTDDLPKPYRHPDIFNLISLLATMTAKIKVSYVSKGRPENYAFSNLRGHTVTHTGSAVIDRFYSIQRFSGIPCPCAVCAKSSSPKKEWRTVRFRTAKHAVFDNSEAQKTQAELFFDDQIDRDGVKILYGVSVIKSDTVKDYCVVECATHDLELCEKIQKIKAKLFTLEFEVEQKYKAKKSRLTVVVSHPHGMAKQISIGEWKERKVEKNSSKQVDWSQYTHTATTCRGSSGAPVFTLGYEGFRPWYFVHRRWNVFYSSHVHSDSFGGLNRSGVGWEYLKKPGILQQNSSSNPV